MPSLNRLWAEFSMLICNKLLQSLANNILCSLIRMGNLFDADSIWYSVYLAYSIVMYSENLIQTNIKNRESRKKRGFPFLIRIVIDIGTIFLSTKGLLLESYWNPTKLCSCLEQFGMCLQCSRRNMAGYTPFWKSK